MNIFRNYSWKSFIKYFKDSSKTISREFLKNYSMVFFFFSDIPMKISSKIPPSICMRIYEFSTASSPGKFFQYARQKILLILSKLQDPSWFSRGSRSFVFIYYWDLQPLAGLSPLSKVLLKFVLEIFRPSIIIFRKYCESSFRNSHRNSCRNSFRDFFESSNSIPPHIQKFLRKKSLNFLQQFHWNFLKRLFNFLHDFFFQ